MNKHVHIGKEIMDVMQDGRISVKDLARKLGKIPKTIHRMLEKEDLHPRLLREVSRVMEHDFFKYYVAEKEHTPGEVDAALKEVREQLASREEDIDGLKSMIGTLEKEIEHRKRENELLQQVNELLKGDKQ